MKIMTTAAALFFLGSDYSFKTRLGFSGEVKEYTLDGDLFLIGGGDPQLDLRGLEQFAYTLKKKGIKKITGNIIVVDDFFSDERLPVGWSWHYLDARYAPEISALSVNKNCVRVKIEATDVGNDAKVEIEPKTGYVQLHNRMKTKNSKDSIIIYRKPEANVIYVDGGIRQGQKKNIDVAVKDPALFAGTYFKEKILEQQIEFSNRVVRQKGAQYFLSDTQAVVRFIDSVVSVPLIDIIKETNTKSENLYAEVLLKTLGFEKYKDGSFLSGIWAIKEFLRVCGVDVKNVSLWDGSGLSKHNLVSAYSIVLVLRYIYRSNLFDKFYNTLPGPGQGTLEFRFKDLKEPLRAKTGAIHSVSCLSGYLTVDNTDYCFSMMFNNYTCSSKKIMAIQEEILRALVADLKTKACTPQKTKRST